MIPAVNGKVQIEVSRVSAQTVEADGMATHYQERQAAAFQHGCNGRQAFLRIHRNASSQARLPCASKI